MRKKILALTAASFAWAISIAPFQALAAGSKFQSVSPSYTFPGSVLFNSSFADLNGDGKTDAVYGDISQNRLIILLGNGDGTFGDTHELTNGLNNPRGIVVEDFNLDGHPDLAVVNYASDTVTIFNGRGDGSFESPISYPTGNGPVSLTAADLNGDGQMDLAIANNDSNQIRLFFGNGEGTFQASTLISSGNHPHHILSADFNLDGRPDLAVANNGSENVSIFLNSGDGTFIRKDYGLPGSMPTKLISGDFNGDGVIDLAAADNGLDGVFVLMGVAGGDFSPPFIYPSGNFPFDITVGDYDGDGSLDLAVYNQMPSMSTSILNGAGDGTFFTKEDFPFYGFLNSGDWNGDGLDDIAYASTNTIHFLNSRAEGELGFDNPSYSVNKHKGEATVTVSRSGSSYGQTKVRLRTIEGTAIAGIDFTSVDDVIEFNAGEISKSYKIQILDNNSYSGDRSFSVTLSNPTNEATLGNQTIATVTINEDKSPPDVTAPHVDPTKFYALDNYSGTPDQLVGYAGAIDEVGATVRAYPWNDLDNDDVVDEKELSPPILLGMSKADGSVTATDIGDLSPGDYKFIVTATDDTNNESPRSASAAVTVTLTNGLAPDVTIPEWPVYAKLTASSVTKNSVRLHWPAASDDRGIDHYELTRNGAPIAKVGVTEVNYEDSGLTADMTYTFSILAVDTTGNRSPALSVNVKTLGESTPSTPSTPSSPVATSKPTMPVVSLMETRLNKLELVTGTKALSLSPVFDPNVFEYQVKTTEPQLKINAASSSPNASIFIKGKDAEADGSFSLRLNEGKSKIDLVVQAENGSVSTYSLFITYEAKTSDLTFKDIKGHWAHKNIEQAMALGIVKGDQHGNFHPDRTITRAEWTVMLIRTLSIGNDIQFSPPEYDSSTFVDSDSIAYWAKESVAQAVASGIISGYKDGTLRLTNPISRAESVVMLGRAMKWQTDLDFDLSYTDDAIIPNWAKPYAAIAQENRVMTGTDSNRFAPKAQLTRAEAATLLIRLSALL
ncbi:MAG TPA: hypothetical protein DEF35_13110 [Paenibacillus sp.]|uniref:FG-GAP-like repeat-containing protein n=1 Tax=Paenibacillus TaxID=44249 RepID=UPI000BA0DE53|nr:MULTISPECIES: FG-GAP-like repeat-containing protein [Paenibacillus]OZQ69744.1 hypothetical protein CA599_13575 [Paenibacillus taichungensis]HBU82554.1 hypothetical protein [Paenibacillus sp.]